MYIIIINITKYKDKYSIVLIYHTIIMNEIIPGYDKMKVNRDNISEELFTSTGSILLTNIWNVWFMILYKKRLQKIY